MNYVLALVAVGVGVLVIRLTAAQWVDLGPKLCHKTGEFTNLEGVWDTVLGREGGPGEGRGVSPPGVSGAWADLSASPPNPGASFSQAGSQSAWRRRKAGISK